MKGALCGGPVMICLNQSGLMPEMSFLQHITPTCSEKFMYLVNEFCFQVIQFPLVLNFISNVLSLHLNV